MAFVPVDNRPSGRRLSYFEAVDISSVGPGNLVNLGPGGI